MTNTDSRPARAEAMRHYPELDGVRGLAIALVLVFHLVILPPKLYPTLFFLVDLGHFGVDIFFVLSGFLITGILFSAKESPRYFTNFYARRCLRIFPLYYGYLICYYFFVVRLRIVNFGSGKADQAAIDLRWLWPYATNILIAVRGNFITASLNHFWTLAVEEHFYFFWPLVVFCLDRRKLMWTCIAMTLFAITLRSGMLACNVSNYAVDTLTPCRLDGFAIGAWFALARRNDSTVRFLERIAGPGLVVASIALMICFHFAQMQTVGYSLLALGVGFFIQLSLSRRKVDLAGGFMRLRWLRLLGKYSYALYVFHFPIMILFERLLPTARLADRMHSPLLAAFLHSLLVAAVSIAVAFASWHLFEKQFLRLKRKFDYHQYLAPSAAAS